MFKRIAVVNIVDRVWLWECGSVLYLKGVNLVTPSRVLSQFDHRPFLVRRFIIKVVVFSPRWRFSAFGALFTGSMLRSVCLSTVRSERLFGGVVFCG
jgi:hypothetical protein